MSFWQSNLPIAIIVLAVVVIFVAPAIIKRSK